MHAAGETPPIWYVNDGLALFAGPLGRNASHRHSTAVYLAGLYGVFGLRVRDSEWLSARAAVVPAGIPYEFDMGGSPLAVLYLEPDVAGADALTPLVRDAREIEGALVGRSGELSLLRELYEDRTSRRWIGDALDDIMKFSGRHAYRSLDPRIARVVRGMYASYDQPTLVGKVAGPLGLSASRFQHLFTREVGVPFRRYRAWHRLRAAIREIVGGSSFTAAAHAVGFCDQAHFAREFRRTFGAPASPSLQKIRKG